MMITALKNFGKSHPWMYKKLKNYYWNSCQRLGIKQIYWVNNEFNIQMRLLVGDSSVSEFIFHEKYENETIRFIARFCQVGDIVFDIGANIGFYTVLFSKLVGQSGQVHAFEPSLRELKLLTENAILSPHKNIHLNQLAVSSENSFRYLHLFEDELLGAYNTFGVPSHPKAMGMKSVDCLTRMIRLDTYLDIFGNITPSLIKVDVEGAELDVLNGAYSLLSSETSPVFVIEACESTMRGFSASINDLNCLLRNYLFTLYSIESDGKLISLESVKTPSLNLVAVKTHQLQQLQEKGLLD